jgi:hypothetical protein
VGTIDVFMRRIIDYAGMFPPASLSFEEALKSFNEYKYHPHADFLGSFVAPAACLAGKTISPASALADGEERSSDGRVFIELNWREPYERAMDAIEPPFCVKLRTGGVTPEAVPPSGAVADFLLAAAARRLPMKATAGLHVPVPNHGMHGFLNVFGAGFLAYTGRGDRAALVSILDDYGYDDFQFSEDAMRVGGVEFSKHEVEELRSRWMLSFGSCSFLEPIEHLERHGLI